jgi:gamma-glutamyltranspeptidase/glutathione hydrolase
MKNTVGSPPVRRADFVMRMSRLISVPLLLVYSALTLAAELPSSAAVASAHPLATEAGIEILGKGGNAFDAAVAVSAALAVVDPSGSGLGGGGFWLLHRETDGKQVMIDGREKAPEFAHARMYLDETDAVKPRASLDGPLAGGIPGIPAGIVYIALNYGRLPLEETLAPAIRFAEHGFPVTRGLKRAIEGRSDVMLRYPSSAAVFLPEGKVPEQGELIIQKDLGKTLRSIAEHGHAGFYDGEVAARLVQGMNQNGGIWTQKDLEQYTVLERAPLKFTYRDVTVVSASPPSSGGIVLAEALKILEHFDMQYMNRATRAHHVIEALRRAYRDRSVFLGDPDFVKIPLDRLLNQDYLDALALTIDPDRATPSDELGDLPGSVKAGESTTHFSIMDTEGNRVGGTLSINLSMGSGFVIPDTGVLVNNEMDDFAIKPNTPNSYGLVGYDANAIAPGKRPLSSMSPTFVETEDRIGILGTPGGSRIISMVMLGILDFAEGELPESWVDVPRYHHQFRPDQVQHEPSAFTAGEKQSLIQRGHKLNETRREYGDMHAVMWDKVSNTVYAASDKRGEGAARLLPKP